MSSVVALAQALVSHPHADPSTLTLWLGLFAALFAAVAGVLFGGRGRLVRSVAALRRELEQRKGEAAGSRKLGKDADRKAEERLKQADELKREAGALRKKNQELLEESRRLRAEIKEVQRELERARHERPAFAEPSVTKAPTPAPSPEARADSQKVVDELRGERESLQDERDALRAKLEALRTELEAIQAEHKSDKQELTRMRKRVDDFKRADLVGRSKTELLEDRLRQMGRQYYDAVSELAALKGEVKPPPPQVPVEADGPPT